MNVLISVINLICIIYIIHKSEKKDETINQYKEENERLQAEIDQLKRANAARQNFDNLCQEIEDKLADTRQ